MNRIAALGAAADVDGFALAGALVVVAEDDESIDAQWDTLPNDIAVLILTATAEARLAVRLQERRRLLTVVMPA